VGNGYHSSRCVWKTQRNSGPLTCFAAASATESRGQQFSKHAASQNHACRATTPAPPHEIPNSAPPPPGRRELGSPRGWRRRPHRSPRSLPARALLGAARVPSPRSRTREVTPKSPLVREALRGAEMSAGFRVRSRLCCYRSVGVLLWVLLRCVEPF